MENLSLLAPSLPSNCAPSNRQATPRRAPDMESYSPSSTFPPPSPAYSNPHASAGWDYPSPPGSPANHQEWRGHPPVHCNPVNEPPSKSGRDYHAHFQGNYPEYPDGNRLSLPPPHGISQVPSTSDCAFPGVLTPRSVDFPSNSPTQGLPAGLASSRDYGGAAEAFSDTASIASYYRQRQMQHHNVFSGGHRTDMREGAGSSMRGKETGGGERWKEGVGGVGENHQVDPRGELFSRRERADLLQPTTSSAWNSSAGRDETTSCISSRSPRFLQKERIANKESLPPAGVVSASWRLQEEERKNMEAYKRRQREAEELEQRKRLDRQRNIERGGGGGGLTRERGSEQSFTDLRSPSNFSCPSSHFTEGGGHTPRHQSILPDTRHPQEFGPTSLSHSYVRECVPPLNLDIPQGSSSPYSDQNFASANEGSHHTNSPSSPSAPSYFEPPQKRRSGGSVADSVYADSVVSQRSRRDGETTFIPRCDDRSARVKHIEGLKSTGSVIPLSAEARSAVVRAESRAALGKHTHLVDSDRPLMGDGDGQPTDDAPYPLNRMDGRNELLRRIEGDKKRGAPRLLPQDVRWNSSAAGVLSSRSALHSPHSCLGGIPSSPSSSLAGGGGESCTARDTMLRQNYGHPEAFECDDSASQSSARAAYRNQTRATTSLGDAQQVTKDYNEHRRQAQRVNPMYSDLFGRPTPDPRLDTATSDRTKTDTPSCRVGISGGDTLDRERANLRRSQLEQSKTAYERFVNAMQSDILGTTDADTPSSRLASAHNARTCLLRDKQQSQRRREQLQQAIDEGSGRLFHMKTDEEVGLPSARLNELQQQSAPGKTVELHLSGLGEDMTEEDIRRICTAEDPSAGNRPGVGNTQLRCSGGITKAENVGRRGPAGCVMRICLATDVLTSKCKGTGKIFLRCREGNSGEEEIVQRLLAARLGVRRGQTNVDPPRPTTTTPRSFHGRG
ncbi:hypothetical protein CSUI_002946 [Cystoisospora suis]|uniref:Uncharacterized protein n=1 Tax=Cystoisospora suis TaxID=483139 RepID=A0A2C6L7G4_9APIC|nr:hypothetical protein CSUI_002946 [Cystoisospora suis]